MCFVGKERVLMKKRTRALNGKDVSFFLLSNIYRYFVFVNMMQT